MKCFKTIAKLVLVFYKETILLVNELKLETKAQNP